MKNALGTDAGVFPHGQNAQEIGLMVSKGGMTRVGFVMVMGKPVPMT